MKIKIINKRIEGRTCKQYQQDNKDKISTQNQLYYQDNKGKISVKNQEYYQKNIDKRLAYHRQHQQDNKDKISARKQQYRHDNKDKISAKIECKCGGKYRNDGKSQHEKTLKYQQNINLHTKTE